MLTRAILVQGTPTPPKGKPARQNSCHYWLEKRMFCLVASEADRRRLPSILGPHGLGEQLKGNRATPARELYSKSRTGSDYLGFNARIACRPVLCRSYALSCLFVGGFQGVLVCRCRDRQPVKSRRTIMFMYLRRLVRFPSCRALCTGAKVVILPQVLVVLKDASNERWHPLGHSSHNSLGDVLVSSAPHRPPTHCPSTLVPFFTL